MRTVVPQKASVALLLLLAVGAPASAQQAPSTSRSLDPIDRPWAEPLWLSDISGSRRAAKSVAPDQAAEHENHGAMSSGAAMGAVQADAAEANVDMGAGGSKALWLRRGADPASAPDAGLADEHVALQIVSGDGKRWEAPFARDPRGGLKAKIDLPSLGFYDAYVSREAVRDGVREVQIAKAEVLKGSCCSKRDDALYKPAADDSTPIEIVRQHPPSEKLMTHINSGEKAVFIVRSHGKPVEGAKVSIETQEGWRKRAFTDADGRVEFTLVRDYLPDWSDFDRRKSGTFLVLAEVERPEAGALNGQSYSVTRYQATIAGRYYPAPSDYQSSAFALTIIFGMVAVGAFSVWFHRQRRRAPFREIVFDEKIA
jgi:hypothetical protein